MRPIASLTKLGLVAALLGLIACESKDALLSSGAGGGSGTGGSTGGPSGGAGVGGAPAGTAGTGAPSGAAGVGGMITGSGGGPGGAAGGGNNAGAGGPGGAAGGGNNAGAGGPGGAAGAGNNAGAGGPGGAAGAGNRAGAGGPGGASGAGGMSTGQGGGPGGASGAGGRACATAQCARPYICIRYCGGPIESDNCCACEAPLFDNFQNRACSDGGTSVSCGSLNTLVDCDARPDCHPVFVDPGTCGCGSNGCCARFNRCAEGGQARCRPPTQFGCTIPAPFCDNPAYVISYTPSCYEGCARAADCAP